MVVWLLMLNYGFFSLYSSVVLIHFLTVGEGKLFVLALLFHLYPQN